MIDPKTAAEFDMRAQQMRVRNTTERDAQTEAGKNPPPAPQYSNMNQRDAAENYAKAMLDHESLAANAAKASAPTPVATVLLHSYTVPEKAATSASVAHEQAPARVYNGNGDAASGINWTERCRADIAINGPYLLENGAIAKPKGESQKVAAHSVETTENAPVPEKAEKPKAKNWTLLCQEALGLAAQK